LLQLQRVDKAAIEDFAILADHPDKAVNAASEVRRRNAPGRAPLAAGEGSRAIQHRLRSPSTVCWWGVM
jgi:hypothetical protein